MGLGTVTHFYGHFESMLKNGRMQPFPDDYNYNDEQSRFGARGQGQSTTRSSPARREWWAYLNEQKANGVTLRPDDERSYEAGPRPHARAHAGVAREVHDAVDLEVLRRPTARTTASFYYDWTTCGRDQRGSSFYHALHAAHQRLQVDRWARRRRHGRGLHLQHSTASPTIRELELMQEAGFHPLRGDPAPTRCHAGADAHRAEGTSSRVRHGPPRPCSPTWSSSPENPLANFKTLYGTGTVRLNDATGKIERVGGITLDGHATASSTTPRSCSPTSPRWCRRRRPPAAAPGIDLDWSAAGPCGGPGADIPPVPTPTADARPPTADGHGRRPARPKGDQGVPGPVGPVGPEGRQGRHAERARHLRPRRATGARSSARSRQARHGRQGVAQGRGAGAEHQAHASRRSGTGQGHAQASSRPSGCARRRRSSSRRHAPARRPGSSPCALGKAATGALVALSTEVTPPQAGRPAAAQPSRGG